ncbi:hypothetical protein WISP_01686 [Willisornis vidua]|uniref:Uncharacterized protein n=1 Tax=Willisornis vidua TaxID=1566151 RepID=A0ABQ9DYQ7_9PASS|nr:hypothetical protein WISP_01686 [Willisornis vidua]
MDSSAPFGEAEDLILINIDNGDISHSKMAEEELEIPDVPAQAAETFIKRVEGLQLHHDLELCHLRASTDLGELRSRRRAWQQRLNMEVQQTTLQCIVNIFRFQEEKCSPWRGLGPSRVVSQGQSLGHSCERSMNSNLDRAEELKAGFGVQNTWMCLG